MKKLSKDVLFLICTNLNLPDLLSFSTSIKRVNNLVCKKDRI